MFLRRNAQLLQQELELEAELLEENPELVQVIHSLNMQEIQSNQQGLENVLCSEGLGTKDQSVWSKFFPLLGWKVNMSWSKSISMDVANKG
ncbi:MAG: hypothetical protein V7L22_23655 [Nostoc sp.]|uniref:hypothetical protein n=1 Tax=Nostoc sp. TaxID=1180 RepID=UPI002FFD3590